jgi:hypothetical protein
MKSPPHYGFTTFPEIRLLRFGSRTAAGGSRSLEKIHFFATRH